MGEAFIVRKGGGGKQALAPTITQVSQTETSVVYNVTNNDEQTATIRIRLDNVENIGETIEVLAGATSQNFTLNNLDNTEVYLVFATANVVGKIKSNITEKGLIPTQTPQPTITITELLDDRVFFTLRNNSTQTRTITYDVNVTPPIAETIVLTTNQTTSSLFFDNLTPETSTTLFASAGNSIITANNFTTLPPRVFIAATGGTTQEYDDSGKRYRSHTFLSNGTFTVTTVGDAIDDRNKVDYLIIAGGGAGGTLGGGGAGGYRTTLGTSGRNSAARAKVILNQQSYTITVGSGGAGVSQIFGARGNNGTASSALGVTTVGGGGGGGSGSIANGPGLLGGSGGGSSQVGGNTAAAGPGTVDEGFNGGAVPNESVGDTGGGGGGAGQLGANHAFQQGGKGGDGLGNLLRTGALQTRAGGGGGSRGGNFGSFGAGGAGGGGAGNSGTNLSIKNGVVNTGSGGGATIASGASGVGGSGSGGSGIVVIRYEIATV